MKTFSTIPGKENKQSVPCALCGAAHQNSICLECEGFYFIKCRKCGLVFQNPQPLSEELLGRYKSNYFVYEKNNEEIFYDLMKKGLNDIGFNIIRDRLGVNKTFLDVGCATGRLIADMEKDGWDVRGVEVCREAALFGQRERGLDIFIGSLEKALYPDNFFSVIHASHLIEHLADPGSFFKEAYRLLEDGGYLIIATPNIDGFQAGLFKAKWRSAIADHMYLFSRKTLTELAEKSGFSVKRVKTWGGLAAGSAPQIIKRVFDFLAKILNIGDVMILLLKKIP